jgi:Flp pilus assembly protein TadD
MDSLSVAELLARGRVCIEAQQFEDALPYLRCAHVREPTHAQARSFYGLCLGLAEREFGRALELCSSAVRQEFFNPVLYQNLATLHLAFGFKADALRCLRRGRMINPAHEGIRRDLERLGFRRAAILRFLPRNHPLNRWLGRVRHHFERERRRAATA